MKYFLYILMLLLISPISFADEPTTPTTSLKPLELLLKVKYVEVENGFYGFETLEGQKYLPTNMPDSFKQDGLPVRVLAERKPDAVGIHLWGEYIRIVSIQMLNCDEANEDEKMICNTID
jgi:hypothetical protein